MRHATIVEAPKDRTLPCPTCGKPEIAAFRPFCSKRCADVDLHRWLSEAYAIPVEPDDDDFPRYRDEEADSKGR